MKELFWTKHAQSKMRYYKLPQSRVRRVIKTPERIEEGIADGTIAMMAPNNLGKNAHEIWVMIRDQKTQRKIISAWRYPGRTKPGEPLPEAILKEFREVI